jgi:LysM repeat protein
LPAPAADAKLRLMKALVIPAVALVFAIAAGGELRAQSPAPDGDRAPDQLETLTKKIDEQNLKIDALSQQILKLEQTIKAMRPGVMIGEGAHPAPAAPSSAAMSPPPPPLDGNAHVVAKGETLTSIAKTHKGGVSELQKFNRIEHDRALQIGQTIMIPPSASASPSPPAPSPSE